MTKLYQINKNYKIILTPADLAEANRHIEESNHIAFDTETTGLNVRKKDVVGFSFSGSCPNYAPRRQPVHLPV